MKKLAFWIVVLVLIVGGVVGYNRYMSGNLKIDRELISDENFDLIAENFCKCFGFLNLCTANCI